MSYMRIRCLSCGHQVEVDESYSEFEGDIKCVICGAILKCKFEDGNLKALTLVKEGIKPSEKKI